MTKLIPILAVLCMGTVALAASPERYLHVKVDDAHNGQRVRVNIPLSLAERVIPVINAGQLHNGRVRIGNFEANGVDVKKLLEALKSAPDGEFVTVDDAKEHVRVAKLNGTMVVHVVDRDNREKVDVTVPWAVAEALASATNDQELDIEAAIDALEKAGDTTLVMVTDNDQTVRVWIDSRNSID